MLNMIEFITITLLGLISFIVLGLMLMMIGVILDAKS